MKKILYVEDNEMNRDMLGRRLSRRDFEVIFAFDGQEGLDKMKSENPDLVLMDMGLPVMDGWEATTKAKEDPEISGIPKIALTAHAMEHDRQKAIKQFQNPKSPVKYFVGNTQTGGYGITLTAASTMIYYSNGYDLEKRQQSEARIDRIGQEKPMTYIDIICEDTVDDRIVKALRKKVKIATQIMGEELKEWI